MAPLIGAAIGAGVGAAGGLLKTAVSPGGNTYRPKNPYSNLTDDPNRIEKDLTYDVAGDQFASNLGEEARGRSDYWGDRGQDFMGLAGNDPGARSQENAELSNRFNQGYGEMQGATQLAREAAMGLAPSEAAYQMQAGLDQATAEQAGVTGGARGAAALGMAQSNEGGNVAGMQQRAFTEAGRLRAQEMAQARGLYGSLGGAQANTAMSRLGQGNQFSQGNLQMNDQYRGQMGQLGIGLGGLQRGFFGDELGVYNTNAQIGLQGQQIAAGQDRSATSITADINQANTKRKDDIVDGVTRGVGTGAAAGGQYNPGGSAPPPPK